MLVYLSLGASEVLVNLLSTSCRLRRRLKRVEVEDFLLNHSFSGFG